MLERFKNNRRVILSSKDQRRLLERARRSLKPSTWRNLAELCQVHKRTLYDWRREKYTISAAALAVIQKKLSINVRNVRLVDPYRHVRRAGHLGGLRCHQLFGNPGTPEGRRKGGQISQKLFCAHPLRAQRLGFVLRKAIRRPRYSRRLAELVGILLGDGHISQYQVSVAFNSKTERRFADDVQRLFRALFDVTTTLRERRKNCVIVVASGRSLVEYLNSIGLPSGDKITNKARVPQWIFNRTDYMKACLRGLMDTDGCLFFHTHRSLGYTYRYLGLTFTSHSVHLLRDTDRLFCGLGYATKLYQERGHLFLYRREDVTRFMNTIGSRHANRLSQFRSYGSSKLN